MGAPTPQLCNLWLARAYVGMKPHMDVVTRHTTIAGDFAMTRSQWLITGADPTWAVERPPQTK